MAAVDSALVLVQPGDTVEAIATKVRQTGARSVELLVPDDTATLQSRRSLSALHQSLARDRVELIIISSDARVLRAARASDIGTLSIEGANIAGPLIPSSPKQPRLVTFTAANSIPEQQRSPADLPSQTSSNQRDAALLESLDQGVVNNRYASERIDDAELYATLDDLSDVLQNNPPAPRRSVDPVLDELDDFGLSSVGEETLRVDANERPRQRVRPEDIAVSESDLRRQPSNRRTGSSRTPEPAPARVPARTSTTTSARRARRYDDEDIPVRRTRPAVSPLLIVLLLLLAVAVAAIVWALNSRATVTVSTPVTQLREIPIVDEIIPYESDTTAPNAAVLQAVPVSADVVYTIRGQVAAQTQSPSGRASGVLQIINTAGSPIELPQGTEFLGQNPQGADVRFTLNAPVTVPGATTSTSEIRTTTEYGRVEVPITARSPGAASNVGQDAIKQVLIPGQQPLVSDSSNFLLRHPPINGGTDDPQWIVTEADVQRVLGDALTGLYNAGIQQLRAQTDGVNSAIDETTITPNPQALGSPESYEPPLITPPVGEAADPATQSFEITVRTRMNALAVRPDRLLSTQFQEVIPKYFVERSDPPCLRSETTAPKVDSWSWDGQSIKIQGSITCTPQEIIQGDTRLRVREAVRGKSREEAEAGLRALQEQGLIGEYTLPDMAQLPAFDFLLDVQFVER